MPIKFDDDLKWGPDPQDPKRTVVEAAGPVGDGETIKEICAWVYQRSGGNEAAATEMTTEEGGREKFQQAAGKWTLELKKISDTQFRDAPAFAVAMALLLDESGNERVVWWGHPITLKPKT